MREKRRQNIKNRVIALIMSLLTVISVLSPNATKTVNADYVSSYPVTINFYKFDGETELYDPKYIDSPINGTLFILATLTDKETGNVVGYGYTKIRRLEKQHDTFYIRDFYTVDEEDRGWITTAKKNPITYNTDKHDISIRLYSCDTDPDNAYGGLSLGYSTLIKQNDNFDGFVFDNQAGETSGVINASQGNLEYGIRLAFDSENIVIDEKSNYYILATATKGSGEKVYYYSQLTTDGSKINDINVRNSENYGFSDWQNSNGNSTISKYSDSWLPIDIKILKAKDGESPNLNSALSGTNVTVVNEIKGNKINHVGVTREKDSSAKKVIDYDVVKFSQIEVSEDYNYLSILGDAVNYGIVSKTIIQNDHSETNFATTSYDPNGKNFDSDLSGNGTVQIPGNYLVGEITGSSNMRIGNNTPGTTLVMVGKGYEDKVQDETSEHYAVIIPMPKDDIDSAVENMIDHMKIVSADMAKKEATITPEIVAGNMYIDTTSFPDGSTIYIDADAYDYYYGEGNKGPLRKDEGLNISMLPNQTIVFNFKTTDEVYIGKAHVNFNDGTGVHDTHTDTGKYKNEQNQFADKIARQLVWNCPVAKSVETHIAGGIYLAPNENVNMVLGDTTCGWGISAGNTTMGNKGEFHYVYDGLSDSNSITLHAYKRVDGVNAASGQTFKFGVQRFDYTANAFVDVLIDGKDSEGNDTKVPYIVENKNEIISIPINYMEDGLNTFRVYEIGKDDNTQGKFKSNKQEFYAQFNVNVIDVKGAQYKVPGGVTYYSKADADGNVSEKLSAEKVVFENETAGNCFVVSKKVTGDEDSSNPYFDITIIGKDSDKDDASPIVGEYDVDGIENADTLAFNLLGIATAKIRKDESITVMGLPEGAYLSVMEAAADGYTLTTAKENLSGIVTNDINNPTKVELVNEYTAPKFATLIIEKSIDGENLTESEIAGALKFTVVDEDGKYLYVDSDGIVQRDEDKVELIVGKDFEKNEGRYILVFKGLPVGEKYTVTETNTDVEGYNLTKATVDNVEVEKTAITKQLEIIEDVDNKVEIKDTYEKIPTTGNLIFTKTVGGDVTEEEVEGALTFTVTTEKEGKTYYLGTDGKLTEDEVVITLKDSIVSHTDGTKVWTAKIEGVEPGKYTVKEKNTAIKAADGSNYTYEFLSEKSVTEKNATVEAGKDVTAALKDEYEKKTEDKFDVQISKQDVNGKEIAGAEIKVTKADDDTAVVDSWTSEADTTHVMKDVPAGSYVLTEVNAPTGYEKVTTSIEFKVAEDGKVTVTSTVTDGLVKVDDQGRLVITNKPEKSEPKTVDVNISKQDIDGNEIAGAEIKVTKAGDDTAVVDSWTSEENKTHTIKGVTAGDYVLTEENAPAGYEKVTTAIEFTVAEDGTITVTSKNTDGVVKVDDQGRLVITNMPEKAEPKKTGSLKITKSFAKDCITESEKEGGLQFRVTTKENGKTYYLDGEGKLTDTETTFTLSADFDYDSATNTWTKTFNNVPVGNYTVEETNTEIEGYKFKGSTINGTDVTDGTAVTITVDADKEAAANIVDDYEKVAELTVKKAVTDSDAAAAAAGKTYRIALKNSKGEFYNGSEFIAVAQYFDVTVDKAYTFKNLPVGETYTVVEDLGENNAKVVLSGFTFSGNEVADVELNDNSEVTVINKYTRDKGDLVITKLVKGPVTEEEFNGAITFSVKDENGNAINVTKNDGTTGTSENMTVKDYFTVKEVDGGYECTLTIKDVPTGKYTVTETNSTFDGYELVSQTGGGEVAVVKGEEAISDFVDEYKAETGSLEIVKDFKEAPENLDASQIVFEISGPKHFNNGEKLVVTYAQFTDGKYVINDAPIGKYTVTETSREETKVDGAYKYTFSNEGSTVTGSREVLKGAKATVTLKNVYDKEELLGSLTVNKSVSMNNGSDFPEGSDLASKTYYVEVRNTDTGLYVAGDGKYSESPVKLEVAAGQPLVLNNIRLGNYTVSEDVADATSVDNRVVYDGSTSVAEASTALTEDSQNQSVTISNVYKHYEEEEIVDYPVFFSKEDSLSGAEVEGATIELYKGDSATGSPYKTWVSSLTSHVENLEEGTYTFKETVAPTGYDVVETAITFTVAKDEEAAKGYSVKIISLSDEVAYQRVDGTLVLKNDPMLGILKVVKVVKTDSGNMPVVDGFNVTIKNLKNNMYVQSVDGKLGKDAKDIFIPIGEDGVGSVEITGLRPATYLVVEKDADAKNVAGFIYDANGSIAELKEEIRLDGDAVKGAEVELVNQYSEDVGKLAITKKITGENPGKSEFRVTVTNPDGKYLTADGKLTDSETVLTVKAGETLTITGVPSGKYTVKEDVADAGNVSGVQFDSDNSIVAKDATVTFGETAEVELVNNYSEIETGKIVVHVTEENSKKDVPDAEVVITNKTTGEEKTYKTNDKGEIVDENGNTPEVPSGDYTIVITDVPEGYNVTTGETGTVTVPKNDTGKHEAVISTERGGIIITVFDEETGSVVPGAKITITTPDGKTNTFVTDVNGQVTEYAKRDQFGNYTEVPGTFKYVVEEVPTGYSVTTGKVQTGTVVKNKLTELVAKIKPLTGGLDIQVVDEKTSKPVENATVEVKTPDGVTVELITDQNGMINKFTEKDKNGNYTAKVGEYDITVTKVPEGYSVTTGQTKSETVVEGEVKHHIAKIAATNKTTVTDTNNQTNNNKTNTNNNTNNNKTNTKKTDTNAKTGDAADIAGVTGLMLLSLAAVVAVIRRKKEDEE